MVLADSCCPAPSGLELRNRDKIRWRLNPAVRIEHFQYAVEDLEQLGGSSLETVQARLQTDPGDAIFLRQDDRIIAESLEDRFARLLKSAQAGETEMNLVKGLDPETMEDFAFAISQGLLLPVI